MRASSVSTFAIFPLHPEPLLKEKSLNHLLISQSFSDVISLFCTTPPPISPLYLTLLFLFSKTLDLIFLSPLSQPLHHLPFLYLSLHSEFLLANCSCVEAHRSSPLMLKLLHDSCWRNPTGTQKREGGGKMETRRRRGRAEEERGQGEKKESKKEDERDGCRAFLYNESQLMCILIVGERIICKACVSY